MIKFSFLAAEIHFWKYQWRNSQSPAETARQAVRLHLWEGGVTTTHTHTKKRKKNPWNFCEKLEGNPDSCNSYKLDYSSLVTSSPALLQPCSLQTWSWKDRRQQGHSAAGARLAKKCALHLRTELRVQPRNDACGAFGLVRFSGSLSEVQKIFMQCLSCSVVRVQHKL